MNEYDIAIKEVQPYLQNELGWPKGLISSYGRVPVQIGSTSIWADFVCYISMNNKALPWLLVEVKQLGIPLEQAIPQAESYSLILDAPFFCVTDGKSYKFYKTGNSQGKSVLLQGQSPKPLQEYLQIGVEFYSFPTLIDNLIELFLVGLKEEKKFFDDTKTHESSTRNLHKKIFVNLQSLRPKDLKECIDHYFMIKRPNRNQIFNQIEKDFRKIKRSLEFIKCFKGDPVVNINRLLDKNSELYIPGGGIFFITQLLSGAHPNKYVVLEENISNALRYLGITDILVKNDTANGYIYVNEICKKLYEDKIKNRVDKYGFGLTAVHNFLWHYYVHYRTKNKWFP